jgi:peptide/nickel transport system permease protein
MNKLVWYILITLARMLFLLVSASVVCFLLLVNSPIDPVTAFIGAESNVSAEHRAYVAEYWGLNKPPLERYATWVKNALHGDLGTSMTFRAPVAQIIAERVKTSLALMLTAWALSGVFGFALGALAGLREGSVFDRCVKTFCFTLASTPTFWFGLLLLMFFSIKLGWFPIGLAVPIGKTASEVSFLERVHHLILPALTLSVTGVASIALHTRQKIIDVLKTDYVLFARARGETPRETAVRHALRNIALPAVTLQFASFSELFGGSVLAENVFSYPGLGSAASAAGMRGDMPLFMAIAVFSVLFVFCGNFIANMLYGVLNPQIRQSGCAL